MRPETPTLEHLGSLLRNSRYVWAPRPFRGESLPWTKRHPDLLSWCEQQTPEQVVALEHGLEDTALPEPLAGWRRAVMESTTLPSFVASPLPHDHQQALGMPGRKWSQLRSLGGLAVPLAREAGLVVDWCAGKAHLGRTLARHTGARLVAVEKDPDLVEAARSLAHDAGVETAVTVADVMKTSLDGVATHGVIVALHACGSLGDAALTRAVEDGAHAMVLAPCCYHRVPPGPWTPRSARGRAVGLRLDRDRLRLACADASCSGQRRTRLRERELAWRRGLDLLRAEATGNPVYRPLPSCPRGWLSADFGTWVTRMADAHAVPLPAQWNPAEWEARGSEESWRLRALGLPRLVFRRALEVWLLLDRAAALEEMGWSVRVGTFCPGDLTPRNLCLVARPG